MVCQRNESKRRKNLLSFGAVLHFECQNFHLTNAEQSLCIFKKSIKKKGKKYRHVAGSCKIKEWRNYKKTETCYKIRDTFKVKKIFL